MRWDRDSRVDVRRREKCFGPVDRSSLMVPAAVARLLQSHHRCAKSHDDKLRVV